MSSFSPVDPRQSFPEMEVKVAAGWKEGRVFERSLEQREDAEVWSFYEGPPTANGRPGSHHVLSRVFKDIYPRYRSMRGYRVPRKAGWDCHGLPVELEVEKQLGISSKQEIEEHGIEEFNRLCRESVFTYVEEWNRLTARIGFWIDLDDPYVTMDNDYIESVWWSLKELYESDRLYEGHRVSPYCPRCGTALSSHEVAQGYKDVVDPSVYVRFPLLGEDDEPSGESLLVWTTTPWTLPGNYAVALNPGVDYARVEVEGPEGPETLILAAQLVEKVLGEDATITGTIEASQLLRRKYVPPFTDLKGNGPEARRIIGAGFVTTDDGTGLVHIAPAFGEDDYRAAIANGMYDPSGSGAEGTLFNPVGLDGRFDDRVTGFAGDFVKDPEVTKRLIEYLRSSGRLFRANDYEHSYPHCWRCGTPLLYYAKASWYIKTSEARDAMLANNESIGWHPEHIREGRFGRWLENNVDWALSRDRYWGTPLPIWECDDPGCDESFCAGSVAELKEKAGTVPEDLHRPFIDEVTWACECGNGEMKRVVSVIDTWYDSGAMPFAQFHYPFEGKEEFEERFPADYICEAIDQTRGWFYTLLAESTLLFDQSSYRNCVCLGLILDGDGQKMSKSKGNVVAPWDVIDQFGADAFRWYLFTAQQPWAGYRFSTEAISEALRSFLLTLWNTYSFWVLYANAEGIDASTAPEPSAEPTDLDRWAVSRLQATIEEVTSKMDEFDCTGAGRAIADYVEELSNWYVRLSRRRFWEGDTAAFATLRHCLVEVAALLAPFTPFIAEEIHQNLVGGVNGDFGPLPDSVHLRDYPTVVEALRYPDLEAAMAATRQTVELGRASRAQAKAKVRQPLARAVIVATDAEREAISSQSELIKSELNVKELEFVTDQSDLVSYLVKPNFRTLGPRFGKSMPQVSAAVAALDPGHVAETVEAGGEIGISIDGRDHSLTTDDLLLSMEPLEGYQVEAESGHAVALALDLDDDLIREGLAREIVHAVQNARKDAGLDITDRISLSLSGDQDLLDAASAHEGYVTGEVLARSIELGGDTAEAAAPGTPEVIIDGRTLAISVARVS
ncbi:MAG TPA: isoleucine--tRNA ligase [Solirubrobacterales bacterium]|nr:isoleucine--tRNA ligase [Solirubrobacterales bacterium]